MKVKIFQWTTPNQSKLINDTVERASSLIFSDHAFDSIKQINVKLVRKLGKTTNMGDASPVRNRPGVYTIRLKAALDKIDLISTLAHELMHIAQFADGRLTSQPGAFVWKKDRKYYQYDSREKTYDEYYNWPWEVEARQFENTYLSVIFNEALRKKYK